MRQLLIVFSVLFSFALSAQNSIRVARDSAGWVITTVTITPGQGRQTDASEPLDTFQARQEIFRTVGNAYEQVAQGKEMLRRLENFADQGRNQYSVVDTAAYLSRSNREYSDRVIGEYDYRNESDQPRTIRIFVATNKALRSEVGTRRNAVQVYSPNYILIRQQFQVGATFVDVEFFRLPGSRRWVGYVGNKTITLQPK